MFNPIKSTNRFHSVLYFTSLLFLVTFAHSKTHAKDNPAKNLKTFGTMGKEVRPLSKSKEAELFSHTGKGCLTHMWFGGAFKDHEYTEIKIYDVTGRLVRLYDHTTIQLSDHVSWHGRDNQNRQLPGGIYFCRLKTSKESIMEKIVFLR